MFHMELCPFYSFLKIRKPVEKCSEQVLILKSSTIFVTNWMIGWFFLSVQVSKIYRK